LVMQFDSVIIFALLDAARRNFTMASPCGKTPHFKTSPRPPANSCPRTFARSVICCCQSNASWNECANGIFFSGGAGGYALSKASPGK